MTQKETGGVSSPKRYNSQKYLLIDTETTGLHERKNAIVEIGAQVLDDKMQLVEAAPFHCLVRPHKDAVIDKRALNVNNHHWVEDHDSDEWKKALPPDKAWEAMEEFLKPHYDILTWIVLVGWNVGFDEMFLKGMYHHINGEDPTVGRPPWPFHYHKIDLLGVVRFIDARMGRVRKSYKLEHMAKDYFGVAADFAMHTALGDSQMCLKVAHEAEHDWAKRRREEAEAKEK
jgi:DNA polymerase III epsilon subunit-like protein